MGERGGNGEQRKAPRPPQAPPVPSDIPAFVKVRERPLKTHTLGRGATVFVCPPAWGIPGEMAVNVLRPHGDLARFFTFDPSGTGESTALRAKEDLSSRGVANDVTGMLLRLKVRPAAIFGHSHGGLVALRVALNHPELVRRIVLVSTTAGDGSQDPWGWRRVLGRPLIVGGAPTRDEVLRTSKAIWAGSLADPARAGAIFGALPDKKWLVSVERLAALPKESNGLDLREKLDHIRAPTLILQGAKDPIVPVEAAEVLRQRLVGSELVVFENSGHFPMLEEPTKFRNVVAEFLARD